MLLEGSELEQVDVASLEVVMDRPYLGQRSCCRGCSGQRRGHQVDVAVDVGQIYLAHQVSGRHRGRECHPTKLSSWSWNGQQEKSTRHWRRRRRGPAPTYKQGKINIQATSPHKQCAISYENDSDAACLAGMFVDTNKHHQPLDQAGSMK